MTGGKKASPIYRKPALRVRERLASIAAQETPPVKTISGFVFKGDPD